MSDASGINIEEIFESAVTIVKNLPKEGPIKPSDALKLKLYALFKQATHGPNDTPKPKFYQFVESYKWEAWRRLGDMPKEDAMAKYIGKLKQIMDTIPPEEAEDNKHFEEILGKKFYDYWFNEWNKKFRESSDKKEFTLTVSHSQTGVTNQSDNPSTSNLTTGQMDTHSDSSGGSSMSMLEEAQSVEADGYKTPISSEECNITGQMRDQFSLAVLRLQHGLDETNLRLDRMETQVLEVGESIRSIHNQTYAKLPINHICTCHRNSIPSGCFTGRLIYLIRQLKAFHWFYLIYPFLVFAVLRALERQRRYLPR